MYLSALRQTHVVENVCKKVIKLAAQ